MGARSHPGPQRLDRRRGRRAAHAAHGPSDHGTSGVLVPLAILAGRPGLSDRHRAAFSKATRCERVALAEAARPVNAAAPDSCAKFEVTTVGAIKVVSLHVEIRGTEVWRSRDVPVQPAKWCRRSARLGSGRTPLVSVIGRRRSLLTSQCWGSGSIGRRFGACSGTAHRGAVIWLTGVSFMNFVTAPANLRAACGFRAPIRCWTDPT